MAFTAPTPDTHDVLTVPNIGHVAIPKGTPAEHVTRAIESYSPPETNAQPTAPAMPTGQQPEITEQGAVEHSPNFRAAARDSWESVGNGQHAHEEAGFTTRTNGDIIQSGVQKTDPNAEKAGSLQQTATKNTAELVHTHPIESNQKPSPADIGVAKSTGKPVMVINQHGLDEVIPGTGEVQHVFDGQDWMKPDAMPNKVVQYKMKDLKASNKAKGNL